MTCDYTYRSVGVGGHCSECDAKWDYLNPSRPVACRMSENSVQQSVIPVTLRFVAYRTLSSIFVRLGEKGGPYTHVEALTPEGTLLGALPDGGVQARPRDYDKGTFAHELYVTLEQPEHSFSPDVAVHEMGEQFYAFLHSKVGTPYNWKSIFEIATEMDLGVEPKDGEICSMLQTWAAQMNGWLPSKIYVPNYLVTPRDLLLMISARQEIPGL